MDTEKVRPVLYGCASNNTCAFCKKHKKYLTPKQIKVRNCNGYGCNALVKLDHPLWEQKAKRKQMRAERKVRLEQMYLESIHAV